MWYLSDTPMKDMQKLWRWLTYFFASPVPMSVRRKKFSEEARVFYDKRKQFVLLYVMFH